MEIGTIIALVIALAAVVVGPAIQLQIAKRQIRAQLVSANRHKWIEELRSLLCAFCSDTAQFLCDLTAGEYDGERIFKIDHNQTMLHLLLSPEDKNHVKLDALLKECSIYAANVGAERPPPSADSKDTAIWLRAKVVAIQEIATRVLECERERIRRGE